MKKEQEISTRSTSSDVAKLAGVSRTQVSYVLNKTQDDHVSSEKRQKILEAATALGYQPNQSAQALRKGYSNEFGIFFPAPYSSRINAMLGTIHETGLAKDCVPTQYSFNSYRDPARKRDAFMSMLARRPIGIFCSLMDVTMQDIELARSKNVKKILILDIEPHESLPTLLLPVELLGFTAAEHLFSQGHTHIAVLKPSDPIQSRAFLLRLQGMKKSLLHFPGCKITVIDWSVDNFRPTLAYASLFVEKLIPCLSEITALYTFSDEYAYPVMAVLLDKGIHIPGNLALLGTDDLPYSELFRPSLSSIRFDTAALGGRAVAMINQLITGENLDPRFLQTSMPVLVPRASTSVL